MGNFLKKINKKFLLGALALAVFFFLGSAHSAHAGWFDLQNIASTAVTGIVFMLTYVMAYIAGIFIALEAWLIGVVLNINASVLQSTFVQTGFSISLAIANLAFVLGIIVIAIATILRNQSYGIKQLLWKLVVMAILVNFGLVIMAPIFNLGNSFTQYFLNCINPGAGGCSGTGSGLDSFNSFAQTLAGSFNPGNPFGAGSTAITQTSGGTTNSLGQAAGGFDVSGAGSTIGNIGVSIFGIVFVFIDLALIVVVLGAFIALLIVRYLYIGILAILLPFAWAAWVFPDFNSHWKKWWDTFIRWTFFAPVVVFFIYLALLTMKGTGSTDTAFNMNTYTTSDSIWSNIAAFAGSAISPIISSFLQEILLAGLIVGGMIAANEMGIKMAGTMVKYAEKQGKAIRGAAWRATQRRVGDRLQTMGLQHKRDPATGKIVESTSWLQRRGSQMQGVPLPFAKTLGSYVATKGSRDAFKEKSGENIKKYATDNLRGLDNDGLLTRANSSTAFINPTEAGAIARELSKRNLMGDPKISASLRQKYIKNSERMGDVQSILDNKPELAEFTAAAVPQIGETVADGIARAIGEAVKKIKVANIGDINAKSMGDPTGAAAPTTNQQSVALNMSPQQLKKLVTEGDSAQAKAFKNTIENMILSAATPGAAPLPPSILNPLLKLDAYITSSPEWQAI